jgi:2-iminobutanoate/2-iminopropanoate deaminase
MSCCCTTKQVIQAEQAPKPIGPYSAGVQLGQLIFTAGQLGIDLQTGNLVAGGIQAETRQALTNLKAILEAGGSGLDQVVKTTVYLKDMNEFGQMNAIYAEFFTDNPPARSTVQVAALPKGGAVEIEAIASSGQCCCDCLIEYACDEDCQCACHEGGECLNPDCDCPCHEDDACSEGCGCKCHEGEECTGKDCDCDCHKK